LLILVITALTRSDLKVLGVFEYLKLIISNSVNLNFQLNQSPSHPRSGLATLPSVGASPGHPILV